jgi:hypothetical protein
MMSYLVEGTLDDLMLADLAQTLKTEGMTTGE